MEAKIMIFLNEWMADIRKLAEPEGEVMLGLETNCAIENRKNHRLIVT